MDLYTETRKNTISTFCFLHIFVVFWFFEFKYIYKHSVNHFQHFHNHPSRSHTTRLGRFYINNTNIGLPNINILDIDISEINKIVDTQRFVEYL